MIETHFAITVLIGLLLVASLVAMATRWIHVPYTLLLVIVGLIISPMHFLPAVQISPELILLIFLPALLFEASWNLKLGELRENAVPIVTLAVLGIVISVGVVGTILHFGIGMAWSLALLFGCMISATDPVSVLALFRRLGLPPRLTTIVEGRASSMTAPRWRCSRSCSGSRRGRPPVASASSRSCRCAGSWSWRSVARSSGPSSGSSPRR